MIGPPIRVGVVAAVQKNIVIFTYKQWHLTIDMSQGSTDTDTVTNTVTVTDANTDTAAAFVKNIWHFSCTNKFYREWKLSGSPLSCLQQSCPDPIFVPSNALDITVLTCYLDQYFYYNMNTKKDKGDVLYTGIASQKVRTFLYCIIWKKINCFLLSASGHVGNMNLVQHTKACFSLAQLKLSPHLLPWLLFVRTRGFHRQHRCGATQ